MLNKIFKVYYDINNYNKVTTIVPENVIITDNNDYITTGDGDFYNNWVENRPELMVVNEAVADWQEPLEVAKLRKKHEIEQNHLQANLRPMIWQAPLYDNEEEIVSFVFDVKKTDAMVCNPMEILNTTIQLADYQPTKYFTKLVVNKKITNTRVAVSIDKNNAITIKSHLRDRTVNFIDLRTQYKEQLEKATTPEEVNSINPIFNY